MIPFTRSQPQAQAGSGAFCEQRSRAASSRACRHRANLDAEVTGRRRAPRCPGSGLLAGTAAQGEHGAAQHGTARRSPSAPLLAARGAHLCRPRASSPYAKVAAHKHRVRLSYSTDVRLQTAVIRNPVYSTEYKKARRPALLALVEQCRRSAVGPRSVQTATIARHVWGSKDFTSGAARPGPGGVPAYKRAAPSPASDRPLQPPRYSRPTAAGALTERGTKALHRGRPSDSRAPPHAPQPRAISAPFPTRAENAAAVPRAPIRLATPRRRRAATAPPPLLSPPLPKRRSRPPVTCSLQKSAVRSDPAVSSPVPAPAGVTTATVTTAEVTASARARTVRKRSTCSAGRAGRSAQLPLPEPWPPGTCVLVAGLCRTESRLAHTAPNGGASKSEIGAYKPNRRREGCDERSTGAAPTARGAPGSTA